MKTKNSNIREQQKAILAKLDWQGLLLVLDFVPVHYCSTDNVSYTV